MAQTTEGCGCWWRGWLGVVGLAEQGNTTGGTATRRKELSGLRQSPTPQLQMPYNTAKARQRASLYTFLLHLPGIITPDTGLPYIPLWLFSICPLRLLLVSSNRDKMNGPVCTVMLALAYTCYSLPGSWDISHIPQAVWGQGKDFTRVSSACVSPTLKSETDEPKGELQENVHAISCGIKQSNSALSQNTHHSVIVKVSLSVYSYMYHRVYIS